MSETQDILQTKFNVELRAMKTRLEISKKVLTQREWLSLVDILQRYCRHELGENEE